MGKIVSMEQDCQENWLQVLNDACKSTCHFFTSKRCGIHKDVPSSIASGVFVEKNCNSFLFTAAHVVENKQGDFTGNDIYVGIGGADKKGWTLGGEWSRDSNPKIDAAVLKLDNISIEKVKERYGFLHYNEIEINHELECTKSYIGLGFPSNLNKCNPRSTNANKKSKPLCYHTTPASIEVYKKLKCAPSQRIIVHFDKKDITNSNCQSNKELPDPYGVSGGGLWCFPAQSTLCNTKRTKKLIGLLTNWEQNYWIATRIDIFISIIEQTTWRV